jgi:hypothetical protein
MRPPSVEKIKDDLPLLYFVGGDHHLRNNPDPFGMPFISEESRREIALNTAGGGTTLNKRPTSRSGCAACDL